MKSQVIGKLQLLDVKFLKTKPIVSEIDRR